MGDIIVLSVIGLVVALIILSLIRNRKNGKSACSGGCAHCAQKGKCNSIYQENE